MLSSPLDTTPSPANNPAATLTPKSVIRKVASPTEAQPPPTVAITDSSFTKRPTAASTLVSTPLVPTNTPQHRDTDSPGPVSPTPTYAIGFYECEGDMTTGGGARRWNECWRGIVSGYYVSIAAGAEPWGGKGECETIGIYDLTAQLLGTKSPTYPKRYVAGCTELHIKEVSGGLVTFEGHATYTVPILSSVQTFNWAKGIVSCPPDDTEGSAVRTSINCWQGVVNGYNVLVRAGNGAGRTTEKQGVSCSTQGFYSVEAWAPDDWKNVQTWVPQDDSWHQVYYERFYPARCALRIIDAPVIEENLYIHSDAASIISFRDESNAELSVDIIPYLTTSTPTP